MHGNEMKEMQKYEGKLRDCHSQIQNKIFMELRRENSINSVHSE
jgi:hypothetical protein